eukprot:scaffold182883_cov38-Tisochrysis_lutea.AAC.1
MSQTPSPAARLVCEGPVFGFLVLETREAKNIKKAALPHLYLHLLCLEFGAPPCVWPEAKYICIWLYLKRVPGYRT